VSETAQRTAGPPGLACWTDLGGPVHYLDFGGPAGAPVLVCVHGLGGSALNWVALAPLLAGRYRVLAPDLAGHGLTRSGGRGSDVRSNRALLHRFVEAVPGGPVILLGNSMGGMISLIEAGTRPGTVAGLVLLDPALPVVPGRADPRLAALFGLYATPWIGPLLTAGRRRLAPEVLVTSTFALCCADPGVIPAEVIAWHVDLARQRARFPEAGADFAAAARSVVATAGLHGRSWYRRAIGAVGCPVLLVHGALDRLVPASAAAVAGRRHRDWEVAILPGVGHVPQLEAPATCDALIGRWADPADARATGRARPG